MGTLLEADIRGRVALGKAAGDHKRFLVDVEPDGTIVLTPAAVLSETELKLLGRGDILDAVESNRAAGRPKAPPPARHR